MDEIVNLLYKYFGHNEFRSGQREIIESIIKGNHTLAVMPTGGGKSLCFQLPAIIKQGTAIVISPLIALMKDQVDALNKKGINAAFINSTMNYNDISNTISGALSGEYKLLYVAPERLNSREFLQMAKGMRLSFIAVDEAHCISEWGHDFRPAYMLIRGFIAEFEYLPVISLTATATPEVQEDIVKSLGLNDCKRFIRGFDRANLSYFVRNSFDKARDAAKIISTQPVGSHIVYCGTKRNVERISGLIAKELDRQVVAYHAGFPTKYRKWAQEEFINKDNSVIVATNAFGMGIDKSNVRTIIHTDLTLTLEAYYQEAGRAGRDGKPAKCFLLYNENDRRLMEFFLYHTYPEIPKVKKVYDAIYDTAQIGIGMKTYGPQKITPSMIANRLDLELMDVQSIFKLLEKHKIIRKAAPSYKARIKLSSDKRRIMSRLKEMPNQSAHILESLLRSLSTSAYLDFEEIDIIAFLRKYSIARQEFTSAIGNFIVSGLLDYEPPASDGSILIMQERINSDSLQIDLIDYFNRERNSYNKLNKVEEYATTNSCKRNFILNYFHDDEMIGDCGRCSSCLNINSKREYYNLDEPNRANILKILRSLGGKATRLNFVNFLRGVTNSEISYSGYCDSEFFGAYYEYSNPQMNQYIAKMELDGLIEFKGNNICLANQANAIMDKYLPVIKKTTRKSKKSKPDNKAQSNQKSSVPISSTRNKIGKDEAAILSMINQELKLNAIARKLKTTPAQASIKLAKVISKYHTAIPPEKIGDAPTLLRIKKLIIDNHSIKLRAIRDSIDLNITLPEVRIMATYIKCKI